MTSQNLFSEESNHLHAIVLGIYVTVWSQLLLYLGMYLESGHPDYILYTFSHSCKSD